MSEESLPTIDLPMDDIYCDNDFNCRGQIAAFEVADLAKSIQEHGLQFAISVQPACDVEGGLPTYKGKTFSYRVVAGHRRYTAFRILKKETIPATIRRGLNEKSARILNLIENFQRKDLNILQEAIAIKHLHEAGVPRESVAREIGMSPGWVQVRYNLLRLPDDIQQEAAAGMINQHQVKQLCSLNTKDEQYEAVRLIKDAKLRNEKAPVVGKRKKKTTTIKKIRTREEIFEMIEIVAKTLLGYGIHTRVLAWAAGEIATSELFEDIKKLDVGFHIPLEF